MALPLHARRITWPRSEDGYVLVTLLLMMALMAIFAATLVTSITFDIKRDREEEMIHRGTQYSRAIRAYYVKLGRYPTKIEDLQSTSNMRFLRKRYKDPLNCKPQCQDFKLLHYGDPGVRMALSGGIGGGTIPGATAVGAQGGLNGPGAVGQTSALGQNSSFGGNGGFGANSNSLVQNPQAADNPTTGSDPSQPGSQSSSPQPGQSGSQSSFPQPGQPGSQPGTSGNSTNGGINPGDNLGSTAIVGVASTSKDPTIREFNHKKKYEEWQFIYDPAMYQVGLIKTPYQPQLVGFGQQGMQNINGQNGGLGNGTGAPPPGMQNNPNLPPSGGFGTPNQPTNPPQQQ
jgi:hypothetical protein